MHAFLHRMQPTHAPKRLQFEETVLFLLAETKRQRSGALSTRLVDAGGKTLMPGFIDCHFHLLMGSLTLDNLQPDVAENYEEFVGLLQAFAIEHTNRPWLTGFGLHYDLGPGHSPLSRQHLDAVVSDRPVFIVAYDGHTRLGEHTSPSSWLVSFVGATVEPTVKSSWTSMVKPRVNYGSKVHKRKSGALLPIPDLAEKRHLLQKGLQLASCLGITSVHNMDGDTEQVALYSAFEYTGDLNVRIYVSYSVTPQTSFEALEKEAVALKRNYRSDILRGGGIKMFMDGVIEAYTGLLVDEYTDQPGKYGASNYEIDHFNRMVVESDRLSLQVFVHSVGDGGVRRVLDAYSEAAQLNGPRYRRHRIEHIEVVHPLDVPRFAKLGVIASMQPLHAPPSMDSDDIWLWRVGEKRWSLSFAWTTLREAGAKLIFGSDWPIVSQNPMLGIHNALNRLPWKEDLPHQRQEPGRIPCLLIRGGS